MTFTVLRNTGKGFCRLSFNWDLVDISLAIIPGLWVLGMKITEVESIWSHDVKDMYHQHDLSLLMLTLMTWPRSCFSDFSKLRFSFSSLSMLSALEGCHMHSPLLRNGKLYSTFLEVEQPHKLFGILFRGAIYSPHLYLFFNHLYQCELMNIYFTLWAIIQHYLILSLKLNCFSSGLRECFQLAFVSFWHSTSLPPLSLFFHLLPLLSLSLAPSLLTMSCFSVTLK